MRLKLSPHDQTPVPVRVRLEASVARPAPDRLRLAYELAGDIRDLLIPPPASPDRTDELWRHTCFEAFLQPEGEAGYMEINLAPSGAWAAYRFHGYREGMAALGLPAPPHIETVTEERRLRLVASLQITELAGRPWRLGLSAVVEAKDGARSYWALAHPPGRPDFHHAAGFAAALPLPR